MNSEGNTLAEPVSPVVRLLMNGNPVGDWSKAPRCGARTRRGTACQCPAIHGKKRCKLHGGRSTGPRTREGKERSRQASLVHGRYTAAAISERKRLSIFGQLNRKRLKGEVLTEDETVLLYRSSTPERWEKDDDFVARWVIRTLCGGRHPWWFLDEFDQGSEIEWLKGRRSDPRQISLSGVSEP